jgi:hypothetical protein
MPPVAKAPAAILLDLSCAASVFDSANYVLRSNGRKPLYAIEVISPVGGLVSSSGGVRTFYRQFIAATPGSAGGVASKAQVPRSRLSASNAGSDVIGTAPLQMDWKTLDFLLVWR